MNATAVATAKKRSTPPPEADAGPGLAELLRPYRWSFAAVVLLRMIGSVAGLAPLLAVVELGRTLLSPGPIDHAHIRTIVIAGAAGLLVRLLFTAASAAIGHVLDDQVQLSFRRRLAARLGRVPIGWLSRRRTGELTKTVGQDIGAVHPVTPRGHRVELRDVRFAYTDDHEVLRGIDLVLEPGTVTAIVGPSGSGKSTLVRLLPRFFDPPTVRSSWAESTSARSTAGNSTG